MKTFFSAGAIALAATAALDSLSAQDATSYDDTDQITVDAPLLHPAAGMMNEHMHNGREVMIGLRLERSHHSGATQSGTETIADSAIVAAGYTARAQSMDMDMAMLDLMYAPNDKLTLMVMPMYMKHTMTMVGIDPASMDPMDTGSTGGMAGMDHTGHMTLGYRMTHTHETKGFGDTLVSASWRLARSRRFGAHATLGVWVPTGSIEKTNPDGTFVHYGMQPGSGTWDIEPSLTIHGRDGALGWGAQGAYRWRTSSENASGFAFGDVARATAWASYLLTPSLGTTARLEWRHEGQVLGHYNAGHNHAAPPDRQANYGGDTLSAGLGLNWALPMGGAKPPQLGAEVALPVMQDLNGIQLPQTWRLSISLSKTF